MPIPIDAITTRKLVLAKQLYQQAEQQAGLQHNVINRIMSVIGFDLAIETFLNVVISALDQRKEPSKTHNGLLDQCDDLLSEKSLPIIPYRASILYVHSIRNDAQHKAKYPSETEVSDCRTYTRDFCQEVISSIWGLSFNDLSLIDDIDDNNLKELLKKSLAEIHAGNYKKAIALAHSAFAWASETISAFLPSDRFGINGFEDSRDPIKHFNTIMASTNDTAIYYSALFSSGVNLVDYKRLMESTGIIRPHSFLNTTPEGDVRITQVYISWEDKVPNQQDALWVHNFIVDTILQWQSQRLTPEVPDDWLEYARLLLEWSNVIEV